MSRKALFFYVSIKTYGHWPFLPSASSVKQRFCFSSWYSFCVSLAFNKRLAFHQVLRKLTPCQLTFVFLSRSCMRCNAFYLHSQMHPEISCFVLQAVLGKLASRHAQYKALCIFWISFNVSESWICSEIGTRNPLDSVSVDEVWNGIFCTFPKCSLSSGKLGGELVNLCFFLSFLFRSQLPQLTVLINLTLQCIK